MTKPTDLSFVRHHVDLAQQSVRTEDVACADWEDALGGIARAFKLLGDCAVQDAYDPSATLILNLGILSGTEFMTGLRAFFHAYSPLKSSLQGAPAPMWSAGSGKFGTHLRALGIEEVCFTGRAQEPVTLHIRAGQNGPELTFQDASNLCGLDAGDKMRLLWEEHPDAHLAVLGPAGEHYESVRYAAIVLSTVNQQRSGDLKPRFCGRGGMGGVMGSKNLLAIVAHESDAKRPAAPDILKEINKEVARGRGSQRFRDKDKGNGAGGTWANYESMQPVHILPEMNFNPTGTDKSVPLFRENVEQGPYVIKDEACYRCGIKCHKNVYDKDEAGKAGRYRAKLDFEPLNMLSSNIGIFDVDQACDLVELVDRLGMDSISCGVSLSYAMEYNRRHVDAPIADGVSFGDFEAARKTIEAIGEGRLALLGQGTKRLSEELGETGYAMHSKGIEFPAYLPQTNPGYPFALAGGHMSMNTYLSYLYERETGVDYWVKRITGSGPQMIRDDVLGICKFSGMSNDRVAEAVNALTGLDLNKNDLKSVVRRTHLRGYLLERAQGFTEKDYVLPDEAHDENPRIGLPHFLTREFFAEVKTQVLTRFDEQAAAEGLVANG